MTEVTIRPILPSRLLPALALMLAFAPAAWGAPGGRDAQSGTGTGLASTPADPGRQPRPAESQTPAAPLAQPAAPAVERVKLTAGRSTILSTDFDVTRIAVTDPTVADATVVEPREVLIDGKAPGTVTLIIWGEAQRRQYDLVIEAGVSPLEQQLQELFPGEDIHARAENEAIVLSGHVSSNTISLRAAEIAAASNSKAQVVNLLQLPGGDQSQQVLLQVRFAEVSRSAARELGASFAANGFKNGRWVGRSTTQQFAAPAWDQDGKFVFSDFLNLFLFDTKNQLAGVIRALQKKGLFQSLAEPNLIAYNGQEASFLAGGEIPIPVVQGTGAGVGSVTVLFKEFGIRLNFTPTIAGDTIRLKVRPEVSSLDYNNAVVLQGFRIPALLTRRAETTVELRDGQSFAIAGLLDNTAHDDAAAVPVLSKLPIIGNLFKSKATSAARTELMVLITPRLVRPLSPDEVPPLPTLPRHFLPPDQGIGEQLQGGGGIVDAPPIGTAAGRHAGGGPGEAAR